MKPYYHLVLTLLSWHVLTHYTCHPTLGRKIRCIDREREALLQFKGGIRHDYCGLLTSWGGHTDCCQWHGIRCSNQTSHVVMLSLVGEYYYEYSDVLPCLEGKVSPSLGELKQLKHLNLSNNEFLGEIPHQLGNLSELTTLDLKHSYVFYDLSMESLSWISRLSLLTYLDLSDADLSNIADWMTIVSNLQSLSVLRMDGCQLPTKIPSSLSQGNASSTLRIISLSNNNFSNSSIFQWLFNLPRITTQLVYLDLSWNAFVGPIPTELENFHTLSYLSLSGNSFQGSVFKIISKLCNLEQLYLGHNNFTDDLTNVIQSIVNCKNKAMLTLDLSKNAFWGSVPNGIGSFSLLRELYLYGNQLKGEISEGIGQLTMLEKLDVSSNSLQGTLTHSHFLKLVNLHKLYLSDNPRLGVNIDENWTPPFQLDFVGLRSCNIGPHYPKWLKLQKNVSYIDVSNAGISDSIPVSLWNSFSSNLLYLNLSYNQFYGMLPNLSGISTTVYEIDLSSNHFEGLVPSWFTNSLSLYLNNNRFSDCAHILCPKTTSSLSSLDLSGNVFSGELPDCWMNFSLLTSLHLENNKFSGSIPKSVGTLSRLQYLHLYNNSFSGPFPSAFKNCSSLMILNIGYNLFSGNISPWISSASQSLAVLILRKNRFMGELPESICRLNNLQILDLAFNDISGVIPNCVSNFTAMGRNANPQLYTNSETVLPSANNLPPLIINEVEFVMVSWKRENQLFKATIKWVKFFDLSNNKLIGEIPPDISILNGLESLDLSKNKLSGNIPFEIGNLTVLELLDLSNNNLSGEIPISLAKVTTLGILDVSDNNLSGQIPVSTQLQSFDASQYAGNPGLCGAPLPSCSKDPNGDITSVQNKDYNFVFSLGLYISVALGFIVGLWGVCGTLIIKTSWRHAYFQFLDNRQSRKEDQRLTPPALFSKTCSFFLKITELVANTKDASLPSGLPSSLKPTMQQLLLLDT